MGFFRLIIGVIAYVSVSATHAQFQYRFDNISKEQSGLAGVSIMIQDSKGFIWIGTGRGLLRYDGYTFRLFINDPEHKNNLTLNTIGCLYEDRNGKIWIGTSEGIVRLDPDTEKFESFSDLNDRNKVGKLIRSIQEDKQGNIWFTEQTDQHRVEGVIFFDQSANTFEAYNFDGLLDYPRNMSLDEYGNLWISCKKGILIVDPIHKKLIKHIPSILPTESNAAYGNVSSIYFDKNGTMWATSFEVGISKIMYDKSYSLSFKNYQMKDGLMTNHVVSMIKDSKDNYWLATSSGVIVLNFKHNTTTNIKPSPDHKYALKEGSCNIVMEDKSGLIWIGHDNVGMSKLKRNKGFISISNHDIGFETITENKMISVYVDSADVIWTSAGNKGLQRIDFQSDFNKPPLVSFYPIPNRWVGSIDRDKGNNFLLGIPEHGLHRFNVSKGKIEQITPHGTSIIRMLSDGSIFLSDVIRLYKARPKGTTYLVEELIPDSSARKRRIQPELSSITQESENGYWLSTWQGDLYFYNNELNTFTIPVIDPKESLRIIDVYIDSNKFLWVTAFEGIFKFKIRHNDQQVKLNLVRKYTEKDGFISKSGSSEIFSWTMQEDNAGNFWFTSAGLTKLNPHMDSLIHYYNEDGVIEGSSPLQGSAKLKSGHLIFVTDEGAYLFHPDSLKTNQYIPPIEITSFTILNEQSSQHTNRKELKYFENVVSFEFAALDFTEPAKNQYAYQMVGFDPDWIYAGNRRTATYTNLNPGTYTFRVKGSNSDGVWNETGTSIEIIILPPPWKTWWAYTLYGLFFLGLLVLARNEIVKRERLKSSAKLKELEVAQYHEMDVLKSRFFANISHEFRTPLTLLLGPIKDRLSRATTPTDKADYSIMYRNATRLLSLVNQLLDLSRLEAKTLKLKCQCLQVQEYIKSISSQFSSMADSKGIHFRTDMEEIPLYVDPDKLEKILTNLLSNAFKFTATGGSITLSLIKGTPTEGFKNGFAQLTVADTGIGINADELPNVFDRFYQADARSARAFEGSGIGLALTKELVELHHGIIAVTSTPGKGSSFIVKFHLGKDHLRAEEIDDQVPPEKDFQTTDLRHMETMEITESDNLSSSNQIPHILIVEDNPDLLVYLQNSLKNKYSISQATDGELGVAKAIDEIPDLIISDLMMPKMDGLELCRKLKSNQKSSHIPIILLTARAGIENKIEGLETGADDYMAKPFDPGELRARVFTLIENRKKLQKKFAQKMGLTVSAVQVESIEDKFLSKVRGAIEAHLDDTGLGVEQLAMEVAMSHTQLYRKLKALTGNSPNEHIRNMRLDRAASLIQQHAGNISDVAFKVGFNNISYFSKCFKEKFGVSPSEYLDSQKQTDR